MAPPAGWGDQGGLVERPAHPKPVGGANGDPRQRRRALTEPVRAREEDGNWDEGNVLEEPGLRQGMEAQIGGVVDMEDDVYLEFDEEEVKVEPGEPTSWTMLARNMANFKPNTKAMFDRFTDEVWHLRSGIRYSEQGKNYYMITLFSRGDYDCVMRGGPWIFNQNALLVKDLDNNAQPSEMILNSVPVWVRVYNVPWGKQDKVRGMRYGNGLGEAMEVDVPASEQDKKEFLRVRVKLPYDRRLQTQITTGVKGKPREVQVYKLKYERVPYYCSHCGFMGHKKDDCEKKRLGVPSLEYDVHELRCSPYKKSEHRSYFVPAGQASAKRNLSFASFGSAESHKRFGQQKQQSREQRRSSVTPEPVQSQAGSVEEEMPPLMDEALLYAEGVLGSETMIPDLNTLEPHNKQEVVALAAQVDAMVVDQGSGAKPDISRTVHDASLPIVQFPDEEGQDASPDQNPTIQLGLAGDTLTRLKYLQNQQAAVSGGSSWEHGPRASDMIPALQDLSNLQVSFGSISDIYMPPADTILGKRTAEEEEVQGQRLHLSLGLDYEGQKEGGTPKKGKTQGSAKEQVAGSNVEKGKMVVDHSKGFKRQHQEPKMQPVRKVWKPPDLGEAKLSVDGSFTAEGAGAAAVRTPRDPRPRRALRRWRWIEFWTAAAAAGDRFLEVRTDATETTTIPVSHAPSWLRSYLEWAGSLLRRGGWGDDEVEEITRVSPSGGEATASALKVDWCCGELRRGGWGAEEVVEVLGALLGPRRVRRASVALSSDVAARVGRLAEAVFLSILYVGN
ncbi:hypothetical protein ACQ4PT_026934 [Festuca glaucescens]